MAFSGKKLEAAIRAAVDPATRGPIDYEDLTHRYWRQGKPAASVNQIMGASGLRPAWRGPTANSEAGMSRGKMVHEAVHQFNMGLTIFHPDLVEPYLTQYQNFLSVSGMSIQHSEVMVVSDRLGYCGRLDIIAKGPGCEWFLLDIKTGTAPSWGGWEMAGYCLCLEPWVPLEEIRSGRIRRAMVELDGKRDYGKLIPCDDLREFEEFEAAAITVRARMRVHKEEPWKTSN